MADRKLTKLFGIMKKINNVLREQYFSEGDLQCELEHITDITQSFTDIEKILTNMPQRLHIQQRYDFLVLINEFHVALLSLQTSFFNISEGFIKLLGELKDNENNKTETPVVFKETVRNLLAASHAQNQVNQKVDTKIDPLLRKGNTIRRQGELTILLDKYDFPKTAYNNDGSCNIKESEKRLRKLRIDEEEFYDDSTAAA